MSPPKFRVYEAQQRPDTDASSSEAEMGHAEPGAADKFSIYSLLEESGVSECRPLGKRGLAGPVLLHKSYLCPAPGPRSGSRAGLQQPVLDRVSTCWWGTVLGAKGLLSSAPPAPETRSPGGSRLLLMLVANPAPIHKASGIASHEPSAMWHPPVGSPATRTREPRHPRCPSLLCIHLLLPFSRSVVSNSATPWTAACQASPSSAISWSLLRFMSVEL